MQVEKKILFPALQFLYYEKRPAALLLNKPFLFEMRLQREASSLLSLRKQFFKLNLDWPAGMCTLEI